MRLVGPRSELFWSATAASYSNAGTTIQLLPMPTGWREEHKSRGIIGLLRNEDERPIWVGCAPCGNLNLANNRLQNARGCSCMVTCTSSLRPSGLSSHAYFELSFPLTGPERHLE